MQDAKFLNKIFMCVFSDFEWRNKQHRNHNNIHYSCFRCCATVTKIQLSPGSTIVIDMYVFVRVLQQQCRDGRSRSSAGAYFKLVAKTSKQDLSKKESSRPFCYRI